MNQDNRSELKFIVVGEEDSLSNYYLDDSIFDFKFDIPMSLLADNIRVIYVILVRFWKDFERSMEEACRGLVERR